MLIRALAASARWPRVADNRVMAVGRSLATRRTMTVGRSRQTSEQQNDLFCGAFAIKLYELQVAHSGGYLRAVR